MDISVVIQILTGIISVVASFVIIKQKVAQHDEKFASMHLELKESFKKRDDDLRDGLKKLDEQFTYDVGKVEKDLRTCFSKYDEAKKDLTNIEKTLDKKVTLKEVTEEFITRKELDLRLQLIETTTTNTNREVAKMEKQLEEVLHILQKKD